MAEEEMVPAFYLEDYLESIESLPCDLQNNFQLMRELDQKTEDTKAEINILAAEYLATVKTLSSEQRVARLQKIKSSYNKCKKCSDDKVQLAMQTSHMVDEYIQSLDADLARFEADLKERMDESNSKSTRRSQKGKRSSRHLGMKTSREGPRKQKKRKSTFVYPSNMPDMPVDPYEPTYCLCHQVSYGEMVACDNPDCLIEWFHFACVKLTKKPRGKWFCPRCVQEKKKKK